MSAEEFGEWITMFKNEQLHPGADRLRHAQQLAAVSNGPLTRSDKQPWTASQFLPADPWAAALAQPPAKPTPLQLAAQVEALNRMADL